MSPGRDAAVRPGLRSARIPQRYAGSFPDQRNKASPNLFVGGRSCLQFVKNATSVKHHKVKRNKTMRAFRMLFHLYMLSGSAFEKSSSSV